MFKDFFKNLNKKNDKEYKIRKYIELTRQVADGLITYSKTWHPNEGILILQGENKKDRVLINGLVIPPFSSHGPYYSGFPMNELPMDLSYIGTAHSHPSGSNRPSLEDLNHFYGMISIIICHPYQYENIAAYDRDGNNLDIAIV